MDNRSKTSIIHYISSQGLITPYLDVALNPLLELLNDPQSETNLPFELWAVSIALLDTSLEFDEGGELL